MSRDTLCWQVRQLRCGAMKRVALPVAIGGAVVTAAFGHVGLTPGFIPGLGTGVTCTVGPKTRRTPAPDRWSGAPPGSQVTPSLPIENRSVLNAVGPRCYRLPHDQVGLIVVTVQPSTYLIAGCSHHRLANLLASQEVDPEIQSVVVRSSRR